MTVPFFLDRRCGSPDPQWYNWWRCWLLAANPNILRIYGESGTFFVLATFYVFLAITANSTLSGLKGEPATSE